jgi:hypothetical protein
MPGSIKPRRCGNAVLDRVVDRLYHRPADTQEEHELKSITLRLVALARQGRANLDFACHAAYGCDFAVWSRRNITRKNLLIGAGERE